VTPHHDGSTLPADAKFEHRCDPRVGAPGSCATNLVGGKVKVATDAAQRGAAGLVGGGFIGAMVLGLPLGVVIVHAQDAGQVAPQTAFVGFALTLLVTGIAGAIGGARLMMRRERVPEHSWVGPGGAHYVRGPLSVVLAFDELSELRVDTQKVRSRTVVTYLATIRAVRASGPESLTLIWNEHGAGRPGVDRDRQHFVAALERAWALRS